MSLLERAFLEYLDLPSRRWRDEAREERGRYWTGPGRDGLEVAFTSLPSRPTVTQIRKLWSERHGRRAAPLLLVAEHDGQAWLCGPLGDNPTVATRDLSQAERLAAAALSEPSRHFAAHFLARAMDVDPDDVPGLINRGLLSSHELKAGVPARPDWDDAVQRAQPLLAKSDRALVEGLGFDVEEHPKHSVLRVRTNGNARAVAVFLNETERPDAPSDRYDRQTPVTYALNQADKAKLPYVMAVRGSNVRLYSTATSGAVGQRGRTETFVGLDLPLLPTDQAGYLPLLFSADALSEGGTFGEVAEASASFAVDLSERLRERVYTQVIPRLARAIANRTGAATETKADLNEHYRVAVTVLFRLLFIAYAEDSRLLPANQPAYAPHSLKTLARSQADAINAGRDLGFDNPLSEVVEPDTDTTSTDLWDTCRNLFIAVDKGRDAWSVPIYNGGLFSSDATVNPDGPVIADLQLTNAEVGPALVALLVDETPDGTVGPIDFRSLSVREFGTIYEGLLESELARADTDLTVTSDKKRGDVYAPATDGDDIVVEAGGVYLHSKSGARKASGSYFTKPFAVQHLIDTAVLPTLDEHLGRVQQLLDEGDEVGAADALFDFRVADIAMGSGHFLTAVVDALEARYATFLADRPIPHVTAMLEKLRRAGENSLGELADTVDIETSALLRRLIARRCVYGVDINPISVELARVSMWIHTFVPGLPLSFLNHNLIVGDSLTGIGTIDEAMDELTEAGAQAGLFDDPVRDALRAAEEPLKRLSNTVDATTEDIKEAREAADEARQAVQPAADLLDLLVAHRLGKVSRPTVTALDDLPDLDVATAREAVVELNAVHFPVAFPEVFIRERPGFDALVGNPPWEKVKVEAHLFWGRHFPGHRTMTRTEWQRALAQYEQDRPDLATQLADEQAKADALRRVTKAGPYELGSGDTELSRVFAWRFWRLARPHGRVGMVAPRTSLLSSPGMELWRREVLKDGSFQDVCLLSNNRNWVFSDVHPQYTVGLITLSKHPTEETLGIDGPHRSLEGYRRGREALPAVIDAEDFLSWSSDASFPLLPSAESAVVYNKIAQHPRFGEQAQWIFRPVAEVHASGDRDLFVFTEKRPNNSWPVYAGSSFKIWEPDTGIVYAWIDSELAVSHLYSKRLSQARLRRSAFWGLPQDELESTLTLPCMHPRIAFRDVTQHTNRRTVVVSLIPPRVVTQHKAPYLLRVDGRPADEAFLLGVLSSLPFDWYARRRVETSLSFSLLNSMPVPSPQRSHPGLMRTAEIAGRLAAVDERYANWAAEVQVPVGSVTSQEEKNDLTAELDACVARLYGLDEDALTHIFETFHHGWDYRLRLERVVGHFRTLEFDPAPTGSEAKA